MQVELNKAKKDMQKLSVTIKKSNIRVTRVPEDVERETELQDVFNNNKKVTRENFSNMEKERRAQI